MWFLVVVVGLAWCAAVCRALRLWVQRPPSGRWDGTADPFTRFPKIRSGESGNKDAGWAGANDYSSYTG